MKNKRIHTNSFGFQGAKDFANEAAVLTSYFVNNAGEIIQEKVPVVLETSKEYAAKAVELGQEYGKDAYEKTTLYAGQAYETVAETVDGLVKDAKKKLDL